MECELELENLEFVCKHIYELTNIPILVMDNNKQVVLGFSSYIPYNPLHASIQAFLTTSSKAHLSEAFPTIHQTDCLENFVIIPIVKKKDVWGHLLLGPTVFPKPTNAILQELMELQELNKLEESLTEYLQSLPVISSWKLVHASMLLYYELYKKRLNFTDIIKNNLNDAVIPEAISDKSVLEVRQNGSFHQDPSYEKRIYQYITDGNLEDLFLYWKEFHQSTDFQFGKLSKKSELRNQKNLKIASITLATRSAIAGGLHPEIAYTLGDTYIQELEELQNIKDVEVFIEHVVYDFAKRVDKNRKLKYSKPVANSQYYIFKHIYEDLSLAKIAEYVSVNPKYLSNLFKKETGIPITEYIQHSKIEEAKKLLAFTDFPLSKIQALLNFTDQSYFTKVFKKHTKLTPKQYKNGSSKDSTQI